MISEWSVLWLCLSSVALGGGDGGGCGNEEEISIEMAELGMIKKQRADTVLHLTIVEGLGSCIISGLFHLFLFLNNLFVIFPQILNTANQLCRTETNSQLH